MEFLATSAFWFSVLRATTPVLFATLCANIVSKSGLVNLGIEGTMLTCALMGVIGSAYSGSLFVGAVVGLATGILISIMFGFFTIKMRANMIVVGVAINLAATGGTVFLLATLTGDKAISTALNSKSFPKVVLPLIENIPVVGDILSGHNALTYVSWLSVIFLYVLLYKTKLGLNICAVGENADAAKSLGINTELIQYIALVIGGVLASLGGMYLSMGYLSVFTAGMVSGRGYLALATDCMAASNPVGGFFSALLYGFADATAIYLQQYDIPLQLVQAAPYLFIVLVLLIFSIAKNKKKGIEIEV